MAASIPACSFGTVTALKSPTLPLFLGVHFHTILGLPLPFTEPSKRTICFKPTAPKMNNASPANRVRQRSRVKNNHQTSSRGIDTTIVNIVCMFLNMLSRSPDMRTRTTFATASATIAIGPPTHSAFDFGLHVLQVGHLFHRFHGSAFLLVSTYTHRETKKFYPASSDNAFGL